MTAKTKAGNLDELISLINQALDEVEDLRASIEYDEEYMGAATVIVDPLKHGLTRLLSAIKSGQYQTGEGNLLDFIVILKDIDHRAVPCWPILKLILKTHRSGFQQTLEMA